PICTSYPRTIAPSYSCDAFLKIQPLMSNAAWLATDIHCPLYMRAMCRCSPVAKPPSQDGWPMRSPVYTGAPFWTRPSLSTCMYMSVHPEPWKSLPSRFSITRPCSACATLPDADAISQYDDPLQPPWPGGAKSTAAHALPSAHAPCGPPV